MYIEEAFKSCALPHSFGTKVKKEDNPLVQIQETTGLLEGAITSMMVALVSVSRDCNMLPQG